MKPEPEQIRHASPVGVEDSSRTPASDARRRDPKLRFPASLRQAGPKTRPLIFWLRLLVGLALLALIIRSVDLKTASVRPTAALGAAIVAATGLLITSQAVAALRWRLVLGDHRLPWSYLLRLYMIGSFFGLFLPTSVGGDAVRALATARSSERAGRAIASVLIDRGFGVLATLGYAVVGLILTPGSIEALPGNSVGWHPRGVLMVGMLGAGLAVLVLRRSIRMRALWVDGLASMGDLARSPRRLGPISALAVVSQGLIVLLWYTLARGMGFTLPFFTFLWAVPLVSLSALLPVTFAGLGVREGAWLVLLRGSAISPANIVAFSLLYFVCTALVGITGGILFVSRGLSVEPRLRGREKRALDVR